MDDYDKWEQECEEVRKENGALLNNFEQWLTAKGLKPKTIRNHVGNVDFYINEYLLYYDPITRPEHGVSAILGFFEDWFPRKALWANPTNVKGTAASLKKFYQFLFEKGTVEKEDLHDLKEEIKASLPDWVEAAEI